MRFFLHVQSSHLYLILFFSVFFRSALFSVGRGPIIVTSLWNSRELNRRWRRRLMRKSTLSSLWFSIELARTFSVLRRWVWTSKPLRDDSCSCLSTWKTRRNGEEKEWESALRVIALRWYINARVSVRVNSQRGKNVKCSSFMRRCVVINNNCRINYCVRASDVKTITRRDSHENVPTY